jgi:putative transposase
MIATTEQLAPTLGLVTACDVLQAPRSSVYRARQPIPAPRPKSEPVRALSAAERDQIHDALNSERFADHAPREVYATLLDEGIYLCSPSTMYRVLDEHAEVRERRDQLRHPAYVKPELLATRPKQVWSWDTLAPHATACGAVQVSPSCWAR